jgi:hypothetical protein
MDAVITYVNGMEPNWRYLAARNNALDDFVRDFYDYGTLRFVLRGISEHMKFIDRVFLIVSNIEQVPEYVNDNVIIITHDMFIPKDYLPTFNSRTIECFLWNIPDLSEEFIYFNDNMIPINRLEKEDFFRDGNICLSFKDEKTPSSKFNKLLYTCNNFSSQFYHENENHNYLRPAKIMTPFLKSDFSKNFDLIKEHIPNILYKKRDISNNEICQIYFTNCYFYQKKYVNHQPEYAYIHTHHKNGEFIELIDKNKQVLCISSYSELLDKTISETKEIIETELYKILPKKGTYDK